MRVMIVVTHLLGTGHLSRVMTLAASFAQSGHAAHVVSGGMPAPHLTHPGVLLAQLPPLRSDGVDFTRLLTDANVVADADYMDERQKRLLFNFRAIAPDLVITELFPFGRRGLKAEFAALLDAAHASKVPVLSSVRDILAPPSKPAKATFAEDLIDRFYKGVLVHGDPDLTPLSLSWPTSDVLTKRLLYTGFVAPAPVPSSPNRTGILVSTGGGNVGNNVFAAALSAAQILSSKSWHFVVGGPEARVAKIAEKAAKNVTVEGLRPDFRTLLARAEASVSLAGYNTALDLLQSGTPGVLVPFDEGNEVEQALRAKALSELPGFSLCPSEELSGQSLASALHRLIDEGPRPARHTGMDGAHQTVRICERILKEARHGG